MEEKKTTGGQAFPRSTSYSEGTVGMTLRDWFAGQALVGLLAHEGAEGAQHIAKSAYEYADKMLKERRT
jgi:hypothetical protein